LVRQDDYIIDVDSEASITGTIVIVLIS